jgi:ketosteroid isomerase-like protein
MTQAKEGVAPQDAIEELYEALEGWDLAALEGLITPNVFVLPGTAEPAIEGARALVTELRQWLRRAERASVELRIRSLNRLSGASDSERSAWVFDQVEVEVLRNRTVAGTTPVRVTALLVDDRGWRLAAIHWSIPTPSNEEQRNWLREGKLPAGVGLEQSMPPDLRPLAERLTRCLRDRQSLPELYSTRPEAVTIGSTIDEVFLGGSAKEAWKRFVDLQPRLAIRGGIRGAQTPDRTVAWLATHIDISFQYTMPYRFFYIWFLERDDWKIVVSHDSVSMEPDPVED